MFRMTRRINYIGESEKYAARHLNYLMNSPSVRIVKHFWIIGAMLFLYIFLSIYLSFFLSIYLSHPCIHVPYSLSVFLCTCLSVNNSFIFLHFFTLLKHRNEEKETHWSISKTIYLFTTIECQASNTRCNYFIEHCKIGEIFFITLSPPHFRYFL